jgi:acetyl esterase/lipase
LRGALAALHGSDTPAPAAATITATAGEGGAPAATVTSKREEGGMPTAVISPTSGASNAATAAVTTTPDATGTATAELNAALEAGDAAGGVTSTLPISGTPAARVFSTDPDPLQVPVMRQRSYPGSPITFEQTLAPGANYNQYIVSYISDGYKIYALMTIPMGQKPATGWPVIIFNHGYIPPSLYRTTERYVAYVDAIARAGYIVFKSDYRGNGYSQGSAAGGGYGSPGYTDDVLNALSSLKAYKDADPNRIGMWGHSMGGQVTLRAMVVSKDIKAGVIWGGVVAPYPNIFARSTFGRSTGAGSFPAPPPGSPYGGGRNWMAELTQKYGTVQQNPGFWASIAPNSYLANLSGPLQLQASITDEEVPVAASETLFAELKAAGKTTELYTYPNDNHNISANFNIAMARSIAWFDQYVKGATAAAN